MARPTIGSVVACALVALAAVVSAFTFAPASADARTGSQIAALDSGILQQINFIRSQHGLVPLRPSGALTEAADQHSEEMTEAGYFEHSSADGSVFWKRIVRYYPSGDFGYWSVGENLLWASPTVSSAAALQLWMSSPEHRANILAARWREIGIAAVHVGSAPGTYRNLPVTVITTDFGVRH